MASAQEAVVPGTLKESVSDQLVWEDEPIFRKQMLASGLSVPVIDKLVEERMAIVKSGRKMMKWTQFQRLGGSTNPVPFASCSDMGGENGWGAWQCQTGDYLWSGGSTPSTMTWGPVNTGMAAPRFNLTSGAGNDPCTPGGGGPAIPVVAPGFGNSSIQLGQLQTNGSVGLCNYGCAEQIIYPLTVTTQDTNFLYAYAFVLENPAHTTYDQPYVEFKILDQNGDTLPCSYQHYYGSTNLPGFYTSSCVINSASVYRPWTTVGVNLSNYVGQTITIVITNVDCSQGGHFAQSYWDFSCGVLSTNPASYCVGQQVTITAPSPSGPGITYSYQWYQNGSPYTGTPSGTSQTITPYPVPGDTFVVSVQQPSGCNFQVVYVPIPMSITPNFSYTASCAGIMNFTDLTVVPGGSPVVGWNWSFPGGTPATSTAQNPTGISFPPGTYTVTLIATAQSGCVDTISLPVTTGGLPQAAFGSSPVCEGLPTQFSDSSTAQPGDPIASTNWSFPGGNPASSTAANPVVTYPAGSYTATLTVITQGGCTSTVAQPVVVNPLPVAALSGTNVCFNNQNSFTDLTTGNNTVSVWAWDFGDGNTAGTQNPTHTYGSPGTYTVTLIVTNNFGCKDTNNITVVVHPLPAANFTSVPVCIGDTTCFSDLSTVSNGSITGWSWNFGDPASGASNTSNLQSPCHVYSGVGPYTVILTVTSDSGCQNTVNLQATLNPLPVAGINVNAVCLNSVTSFVDASTVPSGDSITVWDWNFGDGSPNSSQQNPTHVYSSSGSFTVTLIVTTSKGCKDTVTSPVVVYSPPVANFTSPADGCAPVCTTFTDISTSVDGTIATWQWSFPGGNPSASVAQNGSSCWITPGTYDVQLIVTTSYGCKDTLFMPQYVTVYPWPSADFCVAPPEASVNYPVFSFCDLWSSDVTSWVWDFGDNSALDSTNTDPIHSYSAIATFNDYYTIPICLYVQNGNGCWDTICHTVELIPEFTFYIPNCFTPNGDMNNEVFFGKSRGVKEYNIWVFDRWGNLIWDCHYEGKNVQWDVAGQDGMSSACKWDGKVEGGPSNHLVQEDVYVWKVRLTDIFNKVHTYIGHVSAVK